MKLKNYQATENVRPAPEGLPDKPFLGLLYASKGMGKTNCLINILLQYSKYKTYDKVYLFSPSILNDAKYEHIKTGDFEVKTYNTYTDDIFRTVLKEINDDLEEHKEYQRLMKLYQKSLKVKSDTAFDDEEIMDLFMMDFHEPVPPRFPNRPPWSVIIFDDLASCKELMSNSKSLVNSFVLLHRHRLCSVMWSCQLYRNAVPKMVRNNLDLFILAKSKSEENMKSVADELSSYLTSKQLIEKWEKATEEPYNFFCVNLMSSKFRFTRNFNEPI